MEQHGRIQQRSILDLLPATLPPDLQNDAAAPNYFSTQLRKGNCVVLLDGLDEVPTDEGFIAVTRAVESMAVAFPENQFVITSRIAGWRDGVKADFCTMYVQDLSEKQIEEFVDTWYDAVEKNAVVGALKDESTTERNARTARAARKAQELKDAIDDNVGIRHLAVNPMLLSIVALVHRSVATLPKERSKLYSECAKIFLEQWDMSRGIRVDDTGLKLEQKEAILRRLAYAFHTGAVGASSGGREAEREQICAEVAKILPALMKEPEEANRLLQRLLERSGILIERRRGILTFSHHTFQEYFTAKHLATDPNGAAFLLRDDRLASDWWHEVILLYAGLLPDAGPFIGSVLASGGTELCRPTLRLAGLCMVEAVQFNDLHVRSDLIRRLIAVRNGNATKGAPINMAPEIGEYLGRWAKYPHWFEYASRASLRDCRFEDAEKVVQDALVVRPFGAIQAAGLRRVVELEHWHDLEAIRSKVYDLTSSEHRYTQKLATMALLKLRAYEAEPWRGRLHSKILQLDDDSLTSLVSMVVQSNLPVEHCAFTSFIVNLWSATSQNTGRAILLPLVIKSSITQDDIECVQGAIVEFDSSLMVRLVAALPHCRNHEIADCIIKAILDNAGDNQTWLVPASLDAVSKIPAQYISEDLLKELISAAISDRIWRWSSASLYSILRQLSTEIGDRLANILLNEFGDDSYVRGETIRLFGALVLDQEAAAVCTWLSHILTSKAGRSTKLMALYAYSSQARGSANEEVSRFCVALQPRRAERPIVLNVLGHLYEGTRDAAVFAQVEQHLQRASYVTRCYAIAAMGRIGVPDGVRVDEASIISLIDDYPTNASMGRIRRGLAEIVGRNLATGHEYEPVAFNAEMLASCIAELRIDSECVLDSVVGLLSDHRERSRDLRMFEMYQIVGISRYLNAVPNWHRWANEELDVVIRANGGSLFDDRIRDRMLVSDLANLAERALANWVGRKESLRLFDRLVASQARGAISLALSVLALAPDPIDIGKAATVLLSAMRSHEADDQWAALQALRRYSFQELSEPVRRAALGLLAVENFQVRDTAWEIIMDAGPIKSNGRRPRRLYSIPVE